MAADDTLEKEPTPDGEQIGELAGLTASQLPAAQSLPPTQSLFSAPGAAPASEWAPVPMPGYAPAPIPPAAGYQPAPGA
jgi:hypothetical protein